jgi:hypothetical protein
MVDHQDELMAKYRVQSPDGVTFEVNAPDTASQEEVMAYAQSEFAKRPAMTMKAAPGMAGGVLHGVGQGVRDSVDAAAQMLYHALPKGAQGALDSADRFLGDKIPGVKFAPVDETIKRVGAEYEAARAAQGRDGFDAARLTGNVVGAVANPVNKLLPAGAATALGRVGQAAIQGGVGASFMPVSDTANFWTEKAKQVGIGTFAGGVAGGIAEELAPKVAGLVDRFSPSSTVSQAKAALRSGVPSADAKTALSKAIAEIRRESGMTNAGPAVSLGMPQEQFDSLAREITEAMAAGKNLDAKALARQAVANGVLGQGARLTVGQATREPMQFARELNLRGVEGVGQPMQQRMAAQNNALIDAVRGGGPLPDAYEAGTVGLNALRQVDQRMAGDVTAAYKAFRESGATSIDVPMQRLVQSYQETLKQFGTENIPSAVQSKIKSYLSRNGARQTKVFDLEDASNLLSQINSHYDPTKPTQQLALDRIKNALQGSVDEIADAAVPVGDANLLKQAVGKARDRFRLHDALPALKDIARKDPPAQERFVREYITGGSVDQVKKLSEVLPADAMESIRGAIRRQILTESAPGAEFGRETAALSQAALRRSIDRFGQRKLQALLGEGEAGKLATVQQVAEWIMKDPPGAVVNRSGTASAMVNMMQKIPGGGIIGVPLKIVGDAAKKMKDESAVRNALAGELPKPAAELSAEEIARIRPYLNYLAMPIGGAAAASQR